MSRNKPNQAEFTKNKIFEEAFKNRYGKDVEVLSAVTLSESGKLDKASVHILTPEKKYVITEMFDGEGRTDHVMSGKEETMHKYKTYLEAEVYIADLIAGEKDGKSK